MARSLCSGLAVSLSFLTSFALAQEKYPVQQHSWYKQYYPGPIDYCYAGCDTAAGYVTFNFTPPASATEYYGMVYSNPLLIKSIYYCAQKYCTLAEAEHGRKIANYDVEFQAGFPLPPIQDYLLSAEDLAKVPVLNETAALATAEAPVDHAIIPSPDFHALGVLTTRKFYLNWDVSFDFTFACISFWGLVVLVGMIHRVTMLLKKPADTPQSGWWLWIRRTLILPATFGKHQAEAVGNTFTIPPRLESIILFLYAAMNFIMCFPAYDLFAGNLFYPESKLALARYISDRTGFLSICQLPMVWVFAARNDPFMWLTGWSFATYNRFHRWIARISVVQAIAHSIGWTVYEFYSGKTNYAEAWRDQYWYMGGVATVLMSLMLVASAWYFRQRWYDLFLVTHIVMSIVFFIALWYHVRIFNGEFNYYLYPCIAMWSIDRLLRLGRTVYISIIPRFAKGVKVTATYHRTTEVVRLDVSQFLSKKDIVPGQFYYLYVPAGLRGYESHPFTLCSWRQLDSLPPSPQVEAEVNADFKDVELSVHPVSGRAAQGEIAHTFLIRPYKGMTGRMQRKLMAADESVASSEETVFLEGPYGHKLDLSHYSDVLILCGGSGITAAISHSHFLMRANSTTKVHIVWAVPQRHLPDDICMNELAYVIHTERVNMVVYLTSAAEREAHDQANKLPNSPPYEIRFGRPDVEGVMREYRRLATRNLAIVTCGTLQLSDVCRKAIVGVLGEEGPDVGYYNETMIW